MFGDPMAFLLAGLLASRLPTASLGYHIENIFLYYLFFLVKRK